MGVGRICAFPSHKRDVRVRGTVGRTVLVLGFHGLVRGCEGRERLRGGLTSDAARLAAGAPGLTRGEKNDYGEGTHRGQCHDADLFEGIRVAAHSVLQSQ